jgi:hypothetical protein
MQKSLLEHTKKSGIIVLMRVCPLSGATLQQGYLDCQPSGCAIKVNHSQPFLEAGGARPAKVETLQPRSFIPSRLSRLPCLAKYLPKHLAFYDF